MVTVMEKTLSGHNKCRVQGKAAETVVPAQRGVSGLYTITAV
jgi:hypothetical protein